MPKPQNYTAPVCPVAAGSFHLAYMWYPGVALGASFGVQPAAAPGVVRAFVFASSDANGPPQPTITDGSNAYVVSTAAIPSANVKAMSVMVAQVGATTGVSIPAQSPSVVMMVCDAVGPNAIQSVIQIVFPNAVSNAVLTLFEWHPVGS